MPLILNKDEFFMQERMLLKKIKTSIFIYPTDTIYGIGCDATNQRLVKKIRQLKKTDKPFSIIAPSSTWIKENVVVNTKAKAWLKKLPGPYTLIMNIRNTACVAPAVTNGKDTLGIRVPNHWIVDIVSKLGVPIVTTSANITGENFMTTLDDLNTPFKKRVEVVLYDGPLQGTPSTLITLTDDDVKIQERKPFSK
jgi:tRNA threonylcarbamoyl adenosine modification protein (Sua5/YciO/YrdC/YwlC family)